MRAVLEKLRGLQVIDATDEQLTALVLQAVLANTAWHSFENPPARRGPRIRFWNKGCGVSPAGDVVAVRQRASRPYLGYLRGRYAT